MANKRIKDLAALKYKGFMALDDVDGTGKFPIENLIGSIAPIFSSTVNYTIGQSVMYNGIQHTFIAPHTGEWDGNDAVPVASSGMPIISDYTLTSGKYLKSSGQEVSFVAGNIIKVHVSPGSKYEYIGRLYGDMAIGEFTNEDILVTTHYINGYSSSDPYYRMVFTVSENTSYIKASIWTIRTDAAPVVRNLMIESNDIVRMFKEYDATSSGPLPKRFFGNGWWNQNGTWTDQQNFFAYSSDIIGGCEYVYDGYMYSSMHIIAYDQFGNVVGAYNDADAGERYRLLKFKVPENAVAVFYSGNGVEPVIYPASGNSENLALSHIGEIIKDYPIKMEPISGSEEYGYYNELGQFTSHSSIFTVSFSCKPNHRYEWVGTMYGNMAICEFDKNGAFIRSYRRKQSARYGYFAFTSSSEAVVLKVGKSDFFPGRSMALFDCGFAGVVVPSVFYGTVGIQKNIYYDRFMPTDGQTRLYSSASGVSLKNRRLEITPTLEGSYDMVAAISNDNRDVLTAFPGVINYPDESRSSKLKVMAPANPSTAKNILWVGDSISDYQNSARFVKELFDANVGGVAPTFIGTRHTSGTPDESYAGRNTQWICSSSDSPFVYNGSLDFTQYNSDRGISKVDVCVMQMGFNDRNQLLRGELTEDNVKTYYRMFIEKITQANPGIKIVWTLCPYFSSIVKSGVDTIGNMGSNVIRQILCEVAQEYQNVILSDAFYCLDSINGYNVSQQSIASVYASLNRTEIESSDSIHPTELGCKEWAQNVYPAILYALS